MIFVDTSFWVAFRSRNEPFHAVAVLGKQREHVDRALEADAESWLRRHDERDYSFVDATSFALMRHLGIEEAFAFDEDFSAAGFVELRA